MFLGFYSFSKRLTMNPLATYPNSGETYDGVTQTWHHSHEGKGSLVEQSLHWIHLGAQIVGGCCRIRPAEIAALAQAVRKQNESACRIFSK